MSNLISLSFTLTGDVSASLDTDDLVLHNETENAPVDLSTATVSWDPASHTARWDTSGVAFDFGFHTATLLAAGLTNAAGNPLDGGAGPGSDFQTTVLFPVPGDTDLDGDIDDALQLIGFFGSVGSGWEHGDSDFDGDVDIDDALRLVGFFGSDLTPAAPDVAAPAHADSPEPELLDALMLGSAALPAIPPRFALRETYFGDDAESGRLLPTRRTPTRPVVGPAARVFDRGETWRFDRDESALVRRLSGHRRLASDELLTDPLDNESDATWELVVDHALAEKLQW